MVWTLRVCRHGRGAHLATHCARVSSSRRHDEIEEARPREAQEPVRHHSAVLQQAPVVVLFLRRHIMQSQTPSRHTKLSHNKTARLQGACLETDVVEKVRQERGPATHAEVAGVVHEPRRRRERQPQEDVVVVARVCLRRQDMQSQAEDELLHQCDMQSQLSYAGRASKTKWRRRMFR